MPRYQIPEQFSEIQRGAFLLDSNVLIASFDSSDPYFMPASEFLEQIPGIPIVPVAVVIEAWGFLVGSRKKRREGLDLLQWIQTPGKALVLSQAAEATSSIQDLVSMQRIDCVDALIVELVIDIERQIGEGSSVVVATYDTSDFVSCMRRRGVVLQLLDLRSI